MKAALDKQQFCPWALIAGASSGIGNEFARQIAGAGINVVLVARRETLLAEVGRGISRDFAVQYLVLAMDLSQEGFIAKLAGSTDDLDVGLIVSNAGTGNPGEFLKAQSQVAGEPHSFGTPYDHRQIGGPLSDLRKRRGTAWDTPRPLVKPQ